MRLKILLAAIAVIMISSGSFYVAYLVFNPNKHSETKNLSTEKIATTSSDTKEEKANEEVQGASTQVTPPPVQTPVVKKTNPVAQPTPPPAPPDESNKILAMTNLETTLATKYAQEVGLIKMHRTNQKYLLCLSQGNSQSYCSGLYTYTGSDLSSSIAKLANDIESLKNQLNGMLANCQSCITKFNEIQAWIPKADADVAAAWSS